MQLSGQSLPSLAQIFPEGIPDPQIRRHEPAAAMLAGTIPQLSRPWVNSETATTILPSLIPDRSTWSTGYPSPKSSTDDIFNNAATKASCRGSLIDRSTASSPQPSTASTTSIDRRASPSGHRIQKAPTSKTQKEQRARKTFQLAYQKKEAILTYMVQWSHGRTQSQGNRKKSTLTHTKHDIDYAIIALCVHFLSRELEKAAFDGRENDVLREWEDIITCVEDDGERRITDEPLRGSLLWYDDVEHRTVPCSTCDVDEGKACREHSMAVNMERRLREIRDAGVAKSRRGSRLPIKQDDIAEKRARL